MNKKNRGIVVSESELGRPRFGGWRPACPGVQAPSRYLTDGSVAKPGGSTFPKRNSVRT